MGTVTIGRENNKTGGGGGWLGRMTWTNGIGRIKIPDVTRLIRLKILPL